MNREYLVTKANKLVTSHYRLSEAEQKIILTLASMVQPDDQEFKPYQFKITEFASLLGLTGDSIYTQVPKITKELMQKVFEIKQGKDTLQIAWLSSADYKYGSGIVELEFSPKLIPFMLGLKELFISYRLANVLELTGKYSIRLYEVLKSNEYKKTLEIQLDELINMFKLSKTYKIYFNIKNRIIEPAQRELAEKTDITFDYETITVRKKVTALKFIIKPNPKNKPKTDPSNNQLALPEPQITLPNEPTQDDIQAIKDEFQRRYTGKLVDKFVREMIQEKGLAHVQECLRTYSDYIKGQKNITNIGGHFKKFVVEGYENPVAYNRNVSPMAQPVFFTATKKEAENLYDKEKRTRSEAAATAINSMYEMLGVHSRKGSANEKKEETLK